MKKRVDKIRKVKVKLFFFGVIVALIFGAIFGAILMNTFANNESREKVFEFKENEVSMIIPAVNNKGEGVTAMLKTQLRRGSGLVLVNVNDVLADYELQNSARTAVQSAIENTGKDLKDFDVIYKIEANAEIISGNSAGGAMTISLISLIEDKELNEKATITGAIKENGNIESVSGILQKAEAVKKRDIEILVIPQQSYFIEEAERTIKCKNIDEGEYCETHYLIKKEAELAGVRIIRVNNIEEAKEVLIK